MLFSAVLMNIPNSKVCLKGEWSIRLRINMGKQTVIYQDEVREFDEQMNYQYADSYMVVFTDDPTACPLL